MTQYIVRYRRQGVQGSITFPVLGFYADRGNQELYRVRGTLMGVAVAKLCDIRLATSIQKVLNAKGFDAEIIPVETPTNIVNNHISADNWVDI